MEHKNKNMFTTVAKKYKIQPYNTYNVYLLIKYIVFCSVKISIVVVKVN